jgi:serine/threonine-protein kinase
MDAGRADGVSRDAGREVLPSFSPDGRWLAYQSNEGGAFEIYVRAFPGPGGKWRVSSDGGVWPAWSPASRELVFLNQSKVMVAPYTVEGDSFKADKPQLWSPTGYQSVGGAGFGPYAIHPDGKRLALAAADLNRRERSRTRSCSSRTSSTT